MTCHYNRASITQSRQRLETVFVLLKKPGRFSRIFALKLSHLESKNSVSPTWVQETEFTHHGEDARPI
jgi:hypothetical protein